MSNIFQIASQIRKVGENWQSAIQRARYQKLNVTEKNKNTSRKKISKSNSSESECRAKYFLKSSTLSDRQQRYCRCLMHVSSKNSSACYNTPSKLGTGRCYLPYSVCAKSTGTKSHCLPSYNFKCIPTNELYSYSLFRNVPVSDKSSRNEIIDSLEKFRISKTKFKLL